MGSSLLNLANSGDRSKVAPFLVLLIHGGVYIHRCSINGVSIFIKISNFHFTIQFLYVLFFFLMQKSFLWALVSRRSRFQTGTRFFARGSDRNGNVANFCETVRYYKIIVKFQWYFEFLILLKGSTHVFTNFFKLFLLAFFVQLIDIFFQISNAQQCWFRSFVRFVNMKLFCKSANQNKKNSGSQP